MLWSLVLLAVLQVGSEAGPEPASLSVHAQPGAQVLWEGLPVGRTDREGNLTLTGIPYGRYALEVVQEGFRPRKLTVEVGPGSNRLQVRLEPQVSQKRLAATPAAPRPVAVSSEPRTEVPAHPSGEGAAESPQPQPTQGLEPLEGQTPPPPGEAQDPTSLPPAASSLSWWWLLIPTALLSWIVWLWLKPSRPPAHALARGPVGAGRPDPDLAAFLRTLSPPAKPTEKDSAEERAEENRG